MSRESKRGETAEVWNLFYFVEKTRFIILEMMKDVYRDYFLEKKLLKIRMDVANKHSQPGE